MIAFVVLLFFLLIALNWRRIFPWLMLYFVQKLVKKMEKTHAQQSAKPTQPKKNKSTDHIGEYIDYEEVD